MSDYDLNYVGLGKLMENYEKMGSGADGRQERRYLRNAAIAEILRDSIGEDGSGKLDLRKEVVIERLEAKGIKEGLSPGSIFESLRTVKADLATIVQNTKLKK